MTTGQFEFPNPAAAGQQEGKGQPPSPAPAQLLIREATELQWSGFMMLVPRAAPRYMLVPDLIGKQLRVFDLLRPSGPGVAVLHGEGMTVHSAALSADDDSIFLGYMNAGGLDPAGLNVYDTASLILTATSLLEGGDVQAEGQVAPRARASNIPGQTIAAGAAFSQDGGRLFVLWRYDGGVTVHDPRQPSLPVLRTLSFSGPLAQYSNHMLACAGGLLAAAGGGGMTSALASSVEAARSRRRVQLWQVDADSETELRTLSAPDLADSVALSPSGDQIAVGMRNGSVWLLAADDDDDDAGGGRQNVYVEPEASEEGSGSPMVHMLCFSHDGTRLVAGRFHLDDFTIYDVASATAVGRFVHPKSGGSSATFFPADDVLVVGGFTSGPCVFHRLMPPSPQFELALLDASIASSDVASGGELGPIVALTTGSQLSVYRGGGEKLLHRDFGEELFTSFDNFRTAVQVHPDGKLVACVVAKKSVVVVSVADGSEMLRVASGGSCFGLWWSPDGNVLAAATNVGVRVFSVDAGFVEDQHLHDKIVTFGCAFDRIGARMATSLNNGRVTIWELATWTPTRTFNLGTQVFSVCFSNNGDRLAYSAQTDYHVGVLSLAPESDGKPQVVSTKVNAMSDVKFSPEDKFLLCCPSAERGFDQHRMRVLDLAGGVDAAWGELLRTMALPVVGGVLCGRTVGWMQLSQPRSPTDDTVGDGPIMSKWVLYGAVGSRLVATDIETALHAIEDKAWRTEQLAFCSKDQQELVGSIVEVASHCSNVRDPDTGETVLHHLTRARQVESAKKWLAVCPDVTPVADEQGLTALQVAVQLDQIDVAQALWQAIPLSITSVSATLVVQQLQQLSKTHPHLVRPFMLDVEASIVRTVTTFRTELSRAAEVCGLPTAMRYESNGDDTCEDESVTGAVPSIWSDKCPSHSAKQLVAWRAVVLPDLLGDAESSPFHDIIARCDASVFDSKLLELIAQYKWEENVRAHRMRSIAVYGCACAMATVAMLASVTGADEGTDTFRTADVLQGLVAVIEVLSLGLEAFELFREGTVTYFTGPWNILDVLSSSLLVVSSAYHFLRVRDGVRTAGALGAALKCFGLVDYLRSFQATGSLVRMISVILMDMIPFLTVLSIAMLGCTIYFAIHQARSDSIHGLFSTLVTVYHMTLGMGQGIDTSNASTMTVLVVTAFTSFVVVVLLNLLIAIMGDSYEKVKESERVEAIRERARIVVEMEKRFPKSHHYHRFMHYVEAADPAGKSQEIVWEGVTRRVTEVMRAETRQLDGELKGEISVMKGEISEVKGEISEMKGEMSEISRKLDAILASLK